MHLSTVFNRLSFSMEGQLTEVQEEVIIKNNNLLFHF